MGENGSLVSDVRNFLVSSPHGVPVERITKDYWKLTGQYINYRQYGTIDNFLTSIPSVYFEWKNGKKIAKARPSERCRHMAHVEQKNSRMKINFGYHGRNNEYRQPPSQAVESSLPQNNSNANRPSNSNRNFLGSSPIGFSPLQASESIESTQNGSITWKLLVPTPYSQAFVPNYEASNFKEDPNREEADDSAINEHLLKDLQNLNLFNTKDSTTFVLKEERFGLQAPELPAEGKYIQFFVNKILDPFNISIHPASCLDNLTKLHKEMEEYYNNTGNMFVTLSDTSVLCAVNFCDTWFRGIMNGTNNNLVRVYFCDMGYERDVDVRFLRPLAEKFKQLPFLGFHCKLHGIKSVKNFWSVSDNIDLCSLILWSTAFFSVKDIVPRNGDNNFSTLSVDMIAYEEGKLINVGDRLVAEKVAEYC